MLDHILLNPDLVVLLLLVGLLLIYVETNVPGTVVPGVLGVLCLCFAIYGLTLAPVSGVAIGCLLAAFGLLLMEVKFPSHGFFAFLGTMVMVYGFYTLFAAPAPHHVHLATALSAGVTLGGITFVLAVIGMRARKNKSLLGAEGMVGLVAVARTTVTAAGGSAEVRGELWRATSSRAMAAGERAKVVALRGGLTLELQPLETSQPAVQASALN